ncbi:MAG: orotidine-5'-phosphate decarboxylase [Lactobacillaceae bacterium]|jgi:orotidine-5'-phosphate decarboxylase|nr:orotidine-5'-phosphate decarboxylase [Lactobacillaceae bacterium]
MIKQPIFIALDVSSEKAAYKILDAFPANNRPAVKVGMELFYVAGPEFVRGLKAKGYTVFLDLKLYDIPNTVQKATQNLAELGVDYLTVHAAGGRRMLEAALYGAEKGAQIAGLSRMKLLGITQLTSFSEAEMQETQLVNASMRESVLHLAKIADEVGIAGVISSAYEAAEIHKITGANFLTITPGIRFAEDEQGDQRRVMTPQQAGANGADGLVMGRSITGAQDVVAAYQRATAEFLEK